MDLSTLMPQQLQVVKTLDRPLFVSAGAGSGKTFTLTRRIVYALSPESGPFVEHLDQVLAITFTKDAAAEIRDRVRRALIEEGMDEEALTVDDAWISTIHGMCSRILRAHALELGIDPEFTVLTDTDELMDQAVEHVLGRATSPDAAPELAASLKALYAWYPMAGEGGPFGAGATIKGLVRELLELSTSCRAAWTMCAWRAARPTPRRLPMHIVWRWAQARPRPRKRRRHSTPSTRLRRAAKPWRMRRDS